MCGTSTIAFIREIYKEKHKIKRKKDMKKGMTE
jgi:hypothetical protein